MQTHLGLHIDKSHLQIAVLSDAGQRVVLLQKVRFAFLQEVVQEFVVDGSKWEWHQLVDPTAD